MSTQKLSDARTHNQSTIFQMLQRVSLTKLLYERGEGVHVYQTVVLSIRVLLNFISGTPELLSFSRVLIDPRASNVGAVPCSTASRFLKLPARGFQGRARFTFKDISNHLPITHSLTSSSCGGIENRASVPGSISAEPRYFRRIAIIQHASYRPSYNHYATNL